MSTREYPERPVVGVGAIIVDSVQGKRRVLLVRRGREPLKGQWSLPGGGLETGERLADGLRREVREETGLEVSILGLAGVYDRIMPDASGKARFHYVLIDYICSVAGGELLAGADAAEVRWIPESELDALEITALTLPVIKEVLAKAK
ncbi:MAG TPA: NUDIX domain-containing protein [Terriglobales bacterium]|nr:NUDIX domain-containing protein [Terriglobales bacterium]